MIKAYKNGKEVWVKYNENIGFRQPKQYDRLPDNRVVSTDTETFPSSNGGSKTCLVQVESCCGTTILNTYKSEYPIVDLFNFLFEKFSEKEEHPSSTKQRDNVQRESGNDNGRDGRRQKLTPLLLAFYNGEYDYGRLVLNHPDLTRAALIEADNVRIRLEEFEIEICSLRPFGSSPSFEFILRKNGKVLLIKARDMWGYWKLGLGSSADALKLETRKDDLEERISKRGEKYRDLFRVNWEDLTTIEMEELLKYAGHDAKVTRELYNVTADLLINMEPLVVGRDGTIPVSAPGASARMCFAGIDYESCQIQKTRGGKEEHVFTFPGEEIMQYGASAYAGGRVFSNKKGIVQNTCVDDISSCYPYQCSQIPDPVTSEYIEVKEADTFDLNFFKGKFGVICVSGEGTNDEYPALRRHDMVTGRLQYIYGPFHKVYTTIMEVVTGIVSGRLKITQVHGGYWMTGKKETSFIRKHILRLYKLKSENSSPKNAIYEICKLLMNSFYGKLVELNMKNPFLDKLALKLPSPNTSLINKAIYLKCVNAYIQAGLDGLEDEIAVFSDILDKIHTSKKLEDAYKIYCDYSVDVTGIGIEKFEMSLKKDIIRREEEGLSREEDEKTFEEWFKKYQPSVVEAGRYYHPFLGAIITGHASAQLGVWTFCMRSNQADTDSGMGDVSRRVEGKALYYQIMQESGYEAPHSGLGSFECEVGSYTDETVQPQKGDTRPGEGVFFKTKVYSIKYEKFDGTKWVTCYKQARHAIQKPSIYLNSEGKGTYKLFNGVTEANRYNLYNSLTDSIAASGKEETKSSKRYKQAFQEALHEMITDLVHTGSIEHEKAGKPSPLRQSLMKGEEPGIWEMGKIRKFAPPENPHMTLDDHGNRKWKRLPNREEVFEELGKTQTVFTIIKGTAVFKDFQQLYTFTIDTKHGQFEIDRKKSPPMTELYNRVKKEPVECKMYQKLLIVQ